MKRSMRRGVMRITRIMIINKIKSIIVDIRVKVSIEVMMTVRGKRVRVVI
jgi:hypothetical protein